MSATPDMARLCRLVTRYAGCTVYAFFLYCLRDLYVLFTCSVCTVYVCEGEVCNREAPFLTLSSVSFPNTKMHQRGARRLTLCRDLAGRGAAWREHAR